jgi:hypothetical protein
MHDKYAVQVGVRMKCAYIVWWLRRDAMMSVMNENSVRLLMKRTVGSARADEESRAPEPSPKERVLTTPAPWFLGREELIPRGHCPEGLCVAVTKELSTWGTWSESGEDFLAPFFGLPLVTETAGQTFLPLWLFYPRAHPLPGPRFHLTAQDTILLLFFEITLQNSTSVAMNMWV